jgi:small-conductance mechanosensitive channel
MQKIYDFLLSVPLWHLLIIAIIYYIAYQSFVLLPPRLEAHRNAKYHFANAGLFCTVAQLLFIFALSAYHTEVHSLLKLSTFLTWTATLVVILFNSDINVSSRHGSGFSALTRRISIIFIFAAPVIVVFYTGGAHGFFRDVDRFAAITQQGPDTQPRTADGLNTRSVQNPADNPNRLEGESSTDSQGSGRTWRLSHIPKGIFFFIQAFLVTSYYGSMLLHRYKDKKKQTKDSANIGAMDQVIFVLSIAISIWIVFLLLGFDTLSISIFSGLIAIGVSVALRDLLSNYVAGMLLLWDKSVKLDDVISIGESRTGQVKDITMRYMIVEDRNDIQFLIPHTQLINSTFENWTRRNKRVRLKLDIGVAYGSDIEKVKEIMRSVCFEVPRVLKHPLPNPLILSIDESSIHFQLRFRIADPEQGVRNVMSDVFERLIKRFDEAHIEIPFPQREIRLRRPNKVDPPKMERDSTRKPKSRLDS